MAREAGLEVSLDLIYGTPGESLDDWRASLEHAIAQRLPQKRGHREIAFDAIVVVHNQVLARIEQ